MKSVSVLCCSLLVMSSLFSQAKKSESIDVFTAINQGKRPAIQDWIDAGNPVDRCDEQGRTMLHAAVLTGNAKMVKIVLKSTVDINKRDQHGQTALDIAADYGYAKTVMALVAAGAKVTSKDNETWVRKIVSDYEDYKLFYLSLKFMLIPVVLIGISAICSFISYIVTGNYGLFIAVLQLELALGIVAAICVFGPIGLILAIIGYEASRSIGKIRNPSRFYMLENIEMIKPRELVVK